MSYNRTREIVLEAFVELTLVRFTQSKTPQGQRRNRAKKPKTTRRLTTLARKKEKWEQQQNYKERRQLSKCQLWQRIEGLKHPPA